jgi:hypothetical protein
LHEESSSTLAYLATVTALIFLNFISIAMLGAVMLIANMLSVVMLSVLEPMLLKNSYKLKCLKKQGWES